MRLLIRLMISASLPMYPSVRNTTSRMLPSGTGTSSAWRMPDDIMVPPEPCRALV